MTDENTDKIEEEKKEEKKEEKVTPAYPEDLKEMLKGMEEKVSAAKAAVSEVETERDTYAAENATLLGQVSEMSSTLVDLQKKKKEPEVKKPVGLSEETVAKMISQGTKPLETALEERNTEVASLQGQIRKQSLDQKREVLIRESNGAIIPEMLDGATDLEDLQKRAIESKAAFVRIFEKASSNKKFVDPNSLDPEAGDKLLEIQKKEPSVGQKVKDFVRDHGNEIRLYDATEAAEFKKLKAAASAEYVAAVGG